MGVLGGNCILLLFPKSEAWPRSMIGSGLGGPGDPGFAAGRPRSRRRALSFGGVTGIRSSGILIGVLGGNCVTLLRESEVWTRSVIGLSFTGLSGPGGIVTGIGTGFCKFDRSAGVDGGSAGGVPGGRSYSRRAAGSARI